MHVLTAETGAQRMEWHMEAFINLVMIFVINEIRTCFECRSILEHNVWNGIWKRNDFYDKRNYNMF